MIDKIVKKLEDANEKYRQGNPIMSDCDYDQLLETLFDYDPENEYFNKVGIEVLDESRKRKLDIPMASMNKLKTIQEVKDWIRLKDIPVSTQIVVTPKFDGLSLMVNETIGEATTRGDGEYGESSDEHYKLIQNHLSNNKYFTYTYGEVIVPKKVFSDKYSKWEGTGIYANARNFVSGLITSKNTTKPLLDCQYIKYGAVPNKGIVFTTKSEILDKLNENQSTKVQYHICKISELTEDLLISLFHKFGTEYEIDGLIIEINNLSLQNKLGRETSSNNPCYARAFKHPSFEQSAESEVIGISWNISKQGLLKPILHINPIKLDGVTVSNVTGNNARFVKDMGLGIGAIIKVVRSGMVIPKIVDVIKSVDFIEPAIDGIEIEWNEAGIELITLYETDDQKLKKNIAFFEILEADNVSEGVIKQLWDAGYKTIKDILNLTTSDLEKIDRFGKRKAVIVYNSIQKCSKGVTLSKLQHATGIFKGLGSRKLALLEHFTSKPTIDQVLEVEGFAEISAQSYIDGYDKFNQFIDGLPITIQEKTESVKVSNDLDGMTFVFTGVRRVDIESIIESRGGKIGSSVSKNTTHLIMKAVGSGSSKEKKAMELGLKIMTVEQLENLLK